MVSSLSMCLFTCVIDESNRNKLMRFYGVITPPVPNAVSCIWPQFGMLPSFDRCTPPRHHFNHNIPPSIVLLQQCRCCNCYLAKFEKLSPALVLFKLSQNFFNYTHETETEEYDRPEFCNFKSMFFVEFLDIFKNASRSPSATNLDHYGHDQTRLQYGACDKVSSKLVNVEGKRCWSETHRQTDR